MIKKVKGFENYYTMNENGEVFSVKNNEKLIISKDVRKKPAYRFFDRKRYTVEQLLIENGFISLSNGDSICYRDSDPFNTKRDNIFVSNIIIDNEKTLSESLKRETKHLFSDYYITEEGAVYSMKNKVIRRLKTYLRADGYLEVHLYDNSIREHTKIHRAVAETFIDKVDGLDVVNHIDGNKQNNHYTNLQWTDSYWNNEHAKLMGLNKTYKLAMKVCLLDSEYNILSIYDSIGKLSRDIGCDHSTASKQTKGRLKQFSNGLKVRLYSDVSNSFIPTRHDL